MKSKLTKRFLAILLSCLLVMASFAGTFTVGAATDEDAIRAAFEEYVASTVITDSGLSSTYNDAGLIAYLEGKGFTGITIVGAGTTTPESYLQHSVSGFKTGVEGYEDLFAAKDGYVAVVLSYNGANIGCVATLPAYTYDHTDVDTISSDSDFADTNTDGYMDTYTGSAELVILNNPIASSIDWGTNAANIKAIVYKGGQEFSTYFHGGTAFKTDKLPNLKAIRFENGSFIFGDNGVLQNTKVTHVALKKDFSGYIPHHFANGVSTLVVLENFDKVGRLGWAGLNAGMYPTVTLGQGHGEWYVRASSLTTTANKNSGVTPVFNFLFSGTGVNGDDKGSRRWYDKTDGTEGPLPIAYFPSESALATFKASALYTNPTSLNADYRVITQNLTRVSASVKAAADNLTGVAPSATGALTAITAGVALPDGFTLGWVDDTFAVAGDKVTGTLALSDGTNTVKFDVAIPTMDPIGTVQGVFEEYVASTVITTNGMSSTYSDAGLMDALIAKGHAVTLVDSYLQHSQSGFVTSAIGYENLFAAEDGYVSVLLEDANGVVTGYTATIPAYTYEHLDIDTVSTDSDFADTDSDGYLDTYTGSAELLVINGSVASTINWGDNAANIKAIVYNGTQQFGTEFHSNTTFGSAKLANLLAFRMTGGSFPSSGDVNFFNGNNNLTHIALPEGGVYMLPHHFLNGRSGVVRVENIDGVERFGWYSLYNTKLSTIEAGVNRGGLWTDAAAFQTQVGTYGVTPVIVLHHTSPSVTGASETSNRWNVNYPPVIYANEATYNNVQNGSVAGLKIAATWKTATPAILKDAAKAQAAINAQIATVNGADALAAAQAAVGEGYTLAWESYELNGMNGTGVMTMTDGETTVKLTYDELAVQMVNGASIRYMTPAGIRFATRINGIAKLEAEGYTVKVGTIIAINSALGTNEFTKDALTAAGVKYLDIETAKWAEAGLSEFGAYENLTFNVVHGIPAASYATDLSARTYVEATKDGVTETWYSDYSELNNTRNIREVAIKVYDGAPESVKGTLDEYINGAQ